MWCFGLVVLGCVNCSPILECGKMEIRTQQWWDLNEMISVEGRTWSRTEHLGLKESDGQLESMMTAHLPRTLSSSISLWLYWEFIPNGMTWHRCFSWGVNQHPGLDSYNLNLNSLLMKMQGSRNQGSNNWGFVSNIRNCLTFLVPGQPQPLCILEDWINT